MTLVLSLAFLVVMATLLLGAVAMSLSRSVSGFVSMSDSVNLTDSIGVQANPTIPAAQPAILSTRTDNTDGTLTMSNIGHGINTGQRFDLYWVGGHCYGVVAGTVSGTSIPFTGVSGGASLPPQGTAVSVGICVSSAFALTGDNLTALACLAPRDGYFVFNNGTTDVYGVFVTGGRVHAWRLGDSYSNPLAGALPTKVFMSHSDQSAANPGMMASAISH